MLNTLPLIVKEEMLMAKRGENSEIQNIVDRMRYFARYQPSGASPATIRKWAAEIEAQLRVQAGLKPKSQKEKNNEGLRN
jgi:hypothetical protein